MQSLGALNLPRVSVEEFPFSTDYQIRLVRQYDAVVRKTDVGRQLIENLKKDTRVTALTGKMIPTGTGRGAFQVEMLAMWCLWCVNEYGSERAQGYLDSFLRAESLPVTRVLWVLGMGTTSSVTLKGEYVIRPIHEMPDSSAKERFIQNARNFIPTRSPAPECAITKICQVRKATKPEEPPDQNEAQAHQDIDRRMEEIAWLLNALDGVCCVPSLTSGHVEPDVPFGPFGGWGATGRVLDVLGMAKTTLPNGCVEAINDLLDDYDKLDAHERTRIQRILSRLSQAKRGLQMDDKILDLGIAMEMLLLHDNANREQLALAFRLRGSWLLGSSPADRKDIYDCLKDVYKYRSDVAHSGVLLKGDPAKMHVVGTRFAKYQSLAERTVRKIMKDGTPDWEHLITGCA